MLFHRFALVGTALGLSLAGCSDDDDHAPPMGSAAGGRMNGATGPVTVISYGIDADMAMGEITPGQEAGAFVEYESGGLWHLYVSCDSNVRGGSACEWDILVNPVDGYWDAPTADGLERDDQFGYDEYGPWLYALTTADYDGITFATEPGTTVRFDVLLDGWDANGYVRWVSGTAVNLGAATNPVEFKPNSP